MNEAVARIESWFPGLARRTFEITSPQDIRYNCIAWAAGDSSKWWWPAQGYYWPRSRGSATLADFQEAFATLGFEPCKSRDFEGGYEKIAIFSSPRGPAHAARILPNGRWTSKLGPAEDIEHELDAIEGEDYGRVACVMKRPAAHAP